VTTTLLDPETQFVVDGIRRAKTPPLSACTIADARRIYAKGLRVLDIAPDPAVAVEDRSLAAAHGDIPVRVYRRAGDAPFAGPVLLWFHGGGYCVGSIETADIVCRMFAAACACTVVSVEYRLAPEHPFPAAVDDAFGAYRALLDELGDAPAARPIAIAGDSAGGTLALVTSLLARDASVALPAAQLLVYPIALGRRQTASRTLFGEGLFLTLQDLRWFCAQYAGERDLDADFRFAPIAATSLAGLPRTFIAAAQCDPLHDDAVALAAALADARNDVRCEVYAGMTHGFFQMGGFVARARTAHRDACAFLADAWGSAQDEAAATTGLSHA